ncbi:hypothetical protein PFICI_02534 [Pestalotiopsis fici W106-1]|uniref:Uncharacterized protein n=1 Tax=Pestalotiopsis fici (strain W106-1 / CGMCC3.15140) TaxID=1229662 RepID=W3XER7_PESFW|nr:uncharacterized protein PFICI_02534 [Pestalotiopsis fici W106-1]ETS84509.1 hypothetical protein PFICI_02534 [Pestalotiopsis fici W106-1]
MSPAVITVDHQDSLFPVSKNQKAIEDHATISEDDRKRLQASGILDNAVSFSTIPIVGDAPTKSSGDGMLHLEFAEHALIGNTVTLKMKDGTSKIARDYPFTFYNGKLKLTYGQISALAGDFYGTYDPICESQSQRDQIARFMRAYKTLAKNPSSRQPQKAKDILAALQKEVNTVNTAIASHRDPSKAYAKLPDKNIKFQLLTALRPSN